MIILYVINIEPFLPIHDIDIQNEWIKHFYLGCDIDTQNVCFNLSNDCFNAKPLNIDLFLNARAFKEIICRIYE